MNWRARVVAATLSLLVLTPCAWAQINTATVLGTVTDAQGGVLPGVTVTAKNIGTGMTRPGVTDSAGQYRLPALPPGQYEFTAELQGFSTAVRKGVTLTSGAESVINLQLGVAGVSEQVTVTAESPVVETTTSAVQAQMTRRAIEQLPLNGRDYTSLLRLAPGGQSSNGFAVVGSRGRSNQWTVDGVDNRDDIAGTARQNPALDAIDGLQVMVNGFKAEYGQASGGVINVVTRSGTNDLHGGLFSLYQSEAFTARSPYADRSQPVDPLTNIYYGGTLGGPIKRDKLHYFGTFERQQQDTFSASTVVLPSSAGFSGATQQFLAANGIPLSMFGNGGTSRLVRPDFAANNKAMVRIDDQINASHFLTLRYTYERQLSWAGSRGTLLDYNGSRIRFRTNYVTASHKWIVSGTKLNELFAQVGQTYANRVPLYPNLVNSTVSGGFSLGGPTNYPQGTTDYVFQAIEGFSWTKSGGRTGDHVIKIGGQVKVFRNNEFFDNQFRGIYTFPTVQSFVDGKPTRFTQNQGNSRLRAFNPQYAVYIQDDWRPTPGLTFNVGLRYDYQGAKNVALKEITGEAGPGVSKDKNNIAPRFGFSWAPNNSTKQAIYGGVGLYYDDIILNAINNARFAPPRVIGIQIDNPAWPDPFQGGTVKIPPPNINVLDPNLYTPYNWSWELGYRRELMTNVGLDITFVHNRSTGALAILNTNAGVPGTANILGTGAVRPDPNIQNLSFYSNLGTIDYDGLLINLKKRFSRQVQAGLIYTLSKTTDNAAAFTSGFLVPERMDLSWGPGVDDRRHRIVAHAEVTLPLDIRAGVIVEFLTNAPMDVTAGGRDLNGDGTTGDWVNAAICRTTACPGFSYSRNSVRQLSTEEANRLRALFGLAPIASFANNPNYFNTDLALQKVVKVGRHQFQVGLQALNVFNIAQNTQPQLNILSNLFGVYTAVRQPRSAQLTARYQF